MCKDCKIIQYVTPNSLNVSCCVVERNTICKVVRSPIISKQAWKSMLRMFVYDSNIKADLTAMVKTSFNFQHQTE